MVRSNEFDEMPLAFDDDDDDPPEWDESFAGSEYWMHKKSRPPSTLSRCLKCHTPQELKFDGTDTRVGVYAWCPKCHYIERLN